MTKLTRGHDGRYHGKHHGVPFAVWKREYQDRYGIRRTDWFAQTDDLQVGDTDGYSFCRRHHPTRAGAVRKLCQELDMAAVQIPEVDQLLRRWTEQVREVALQVDTRDLQAHMVLDNLRHLLSWFDDRARLEAVRFEQELARLKAYVKVAPPAARIAED